MLFKQSPRISCLSTLPLHDALPILPLWPLIEEMLMTRPNFRARMPSITGRVMLNSEARLVVMTRPVIEGMRARKFRSEEHTCELQSHSGLVCRLVLEKKNVRVVVDE